MTWRCGPGRAAPRKSPDAFATSLGEIREVIAWQLAYAVQLQPCVRAAGVSCLLPGRSPSARGLAGRGGGASTGSRPSVDGHERSEFGWSAGTLVGVDERSSSPAK
jgi:hypothetical protein